MKSNDTTNFKTTKDTGTVRSESVRDAVRRQLSLKKFHDLRRRVVPLAAARGYLTDEDVFRSVSSGLDTHE
jgi:hypothetical protein